MKFLIKKLGISTGGPLIAVLHVRDAERLDLHYEDRIRLVGDSKNVVVILDIASSPIVSSGEIGLFKETAEKLGDARSVEIFSENKPNSISYIKKKLDGGPLTLPEMNELMHDLVHNQLSEVEITYFVAGCYMHKLTIREIEYLTRAIVSNGETLNLDIYPLVDKHCIGGIPGNRTTLIMVPIIAAAGLCIPKTSSRAITSAAGTADTMEVFANVELTIGEVKKVVRKTKGCIVWGGAIDLAPADDRIIRIESALGIDTEGQLIASVMAKKYSVGATHLLLDLPFGKGAKAKSEAHARRLKAKFEQIGKILNMKVRVMTSDGSQPIGNGVGPALEARDVLWILMRHPNRPFDLERKSLKMAGMLLEMGGKARKGNGLKLAREILENGKAYHKMCEIIEAQGKRVLRPEDIKIGGSMYTLTSKKRGTVVSIDNRAIARIARSAGAPKDKGAGIYIHRHVGDGVRRAEPLCTLYAENEQELRYALELLKSSNPFEIR